jgi:hypothetical protein
VRFAGNEHSWPDFTRDGRSVLLRPNSNKEPYRLVRVDDFSPVVRDSLFTGTRYAGFDPTKQRLYISNEDKRTVSIVHLSRPDQVIELRGKRGDEIDASPQSHWSRDGRLIAVVRQHGTKSYRRIDGNDVLVASDYRGQLEVFDADSGEVKFSTNEFGSPHALSPDGHFLAATNFEDFTTAIFDLTDNHELVRLATDSPIQVELTADNRRAFVLNGMHQQNGATILVFELPSGRHQTDIPVYTWANSMTISLSACGTCLAIIGQKKDIFWNVASDPPVCLDNLSPGLREAPMISRTLPRAVTIRTQPSETWEVWDTEALKVLNSQRLAGKLRAHAIRDNQRMTAVGQRGDSFVINALRYLWDRFAKQKPFYAAGVTHMIDLNTGMKTNTIPGLADWVVFPPNSDQVWLVYREEYSKEPLFCFEVWPTHAPNPPWWLWLLTTAGVAATWLLWRNKRELVPAT